uniref:Protein kinase domain-containing protein n=1 Tax=Panagrellus redivivus TaxID=6233 RepID=A0A7E4W861_PANRE
MKTNPSRIMKTDVGVEAVMGTGFCGLEEQRNSSHKPVHISMFVGNEKYRKRIFCKGVEVSLAGEHTSDRLLYRTVLKQVHKKCKPVPI